MDVEAGSAIETHVSGGIATVQFNRVRKKNAVTLGMWRELPRLFAELDANREVRAVILTGSGGSFSAGADISEFSEVRSTPEQVEAYEAAVDGALATIEAAAKPTIAAVSGICFGGGVAIAASADFRIADESALFSISAVRMGLVYNIAKCARLMQLVGMTNAKRILMAGQRFNASEACRLGLVDGLANDALAGARTLADELSAGAPIAVRSIKAIVTALAEGTIESRRAELETFIATADASEDHREAVRAFAEKRAPRFTGH